MSKKKAFSGSTMTLKDFHGGSIPSDLPLPSAPGVVVRPSDRSQIQSPWGNPNGRFDYRSRPGSSGTNRNFDEKASFLSHPAHIGRNFDEDERKPLDGVSMPRRTVSDESIHGGVSPAASRVEPKVDSGSMGKFTGGGRSVTSPVSSNQIRFGGSNHPVGANSQAAGSQSGSVPNAWGMRKEAVGGGVGASEVVPPSSNWSGPNAASRFAQASALEKVSSGRWQSKPLVHNQPNVEVMRFAEQDSEFRSNNYGSAFNDVNGRGDLDVLRGRNRVVIDETVGSDKELMYQERARSPMYLEAKDRNLLFTRDHDVVRPASTEGKFVGSQVQPPMPTEAVERPKLKLLPRSKPLEASESPVVDYKQQPVDTVHVETRNGLYANDISPKPRSAGAGTGAVTGTGVGIGVGAEGAKQQPVERPKLTLKPRSQPPEQSDEIAERERKNLFGGARPRELVLKERGVDDAAINNLDSIQSPNRTKHDHPKTESKPEVAIQTPRYGDRTENFPHDQRTGRDADRKDHRADPEKTEQRVHRPDPEKTEMRGSWRNENWRNSREIEKQPQQERRPELETWRKPIEPPKVAEPDVPGLHGKATSALELVKTFSRSKSDAKAADHASGLRGLPGRNQIPFSRLTDTREFYPGSAPRHHKINGY